MVATVDQYMKQEKRRVPDILLNVFDIDGDATTVTEEAIALGDLAPHASSNVISEIMPLCIRHSYVAISSCNEAIEHASINISDMIDDELVTRRIHTYRVISKKIINTAGMSNLLLSQTFRLLVTFLRCRTYIQNLSSSNVDEACQKELLDFSKKS